MDLLRKISIWKRRDYVKVVIPYHLFSSTYIAAEGLNKMLKNIVNWVYLKACLGLIFSLDSFSSLKNIRRILQCFELVSGLKVIFFS